MVQQVNFELKMMSFVLKMMDFALKMMHLSLKDGAAWCDFMLYFILVHAISLAFSDLV